MKPGEGSVNTKGQMVSHNNKDAEDDAPKARPISHGEIEIEVPDEKPDFNDKKGDLEDPTKYDTKVTQVFAQIAPECNGQLEEINLFKALIQTNWMARHRTSFKGDSSKIVLILQKLSETKDLKQDMGRVMELKESIVPDLFRYYDLAFRQFPSGPESEANKLRAKITELGKQQESFENILNIHIDYKDWAEKFQESLKEENPTLETTEDQLDNLKENIQDVRAKENKAREDLSCIKEKEANKRALLCQLTRYYTQQDKYQEQLDQDDEWKQVRDTIEHGQKNKIKPEEMQEKDLIDHFKPVNPEQKEGEGEGEGDEDEDDIPQVRGSHYDERRGFLVLKMETQTINEFTDYVAEGENDERCFPFEMKGLELQIEKGELSKEQEQFLKQKAEEKRIERETKGPLADVQQDSDDECGSWHSDDPEDSESEVESNEPKEEGLPKPDENQTKVNPMSHTFHDMRSVIVQGYPRMELSLVKDFIEDVLKSDVRSLTLQSLDLQGNVLQDFLKNLENRKVNPLRSLIFSNCDLDLTNDCIPQEVGKELTDLQFSTCKLSNDNVNTLIHFIKTFSKLQTFNINTNQISHEKMNEIGEALNEAQSLRHFHFGDLSRADQDFKDNFKQTYSYGGRIKFH